MAVVDSAGADLPVRSFEAAAPDSNGSGDADHQTAHLSRRMVVDPTLQQTAILRSPSSHDHYFQMKVQQQMQLPAPPAHVSGHQALAGGGHGIDQRGGADLPRSGDEGFRRDMRDLEELLSKLNPMAEEFVPPSLAAHGSAAGFFANSFGISNGGGRRKKNNFNQGKRRMNSRTSMAQREEVIRRTVYVSDIDQQVTEEQLAALFINCGQVVDCRVCGDPNSVLRFAFIEFTDEEGARAALSLAGTMLGYYPVKVLPSKTAIAPVNPTFLPRSEDEREMCARTVYCTNIDKKVTQADVRLFFETICGEVYRLRLLGDYHHSTRIAFVEFVMAQSAINALNCSGVVLGSLPIRVSPSKTPVRPRSPRAPPMH
ncbi:polyadenylate-binding protein-interacting protein 12-like protein isoform X1 [Cinnamomum micranthum f. kanehirae]|uniref:Polyadenylate-binding protein-interacting protein 12-like protein isoform X1 n=1 Tax=Cinnamomum micranthum f. kanehirae TaxID=337451 RepID=A0A443PA85_9MAGN|nr:polyadenylate-binding protein-interacting protein 12-like protein isoform X1 [Cinnamomum micranthum f. kanehirae]